MLWHFPVTQSDKWKLNKLGKHKQMCLYAEPCVTFTRLIRVVRLWRAWDCVVLWCHQTITCCTLHQSSIPLLAGGEPIRRWPYVVYLGWARLGIIGQSPAIRSGFRRGPRFPYTGQGLILIPGSNHRGQSWTTLCLASHLGPICLERPYQDLMPRTTNLPGSLRHSNPSTTLRWWSKEDLKQIFQIFWLINMWNMCWVN